MTEKKKKTEVFDLTADDLLDAESAPTACEIPALKRGTAVGVVYLKQPTAYDVFEYTRTGSDEAGQLRAMTGIIARCAVRPDGSPLFNEEQAERLPHVRLDVFTPISTRLAEMIQFAAGGADTEGNASGGTEATG